MTGAQRGDAAPGRRGPRRVLDWSADDGVFTLEIAATVDEDEVGHVFITLEQRPSEWDEADKVLPSVRIAVDLDGTNVDKIREALTEAVTWGREYLS